jgi:hypothetical protein
MNQSGRLTLLVCPSPPPPLIHQPLSFVYLIGVNYFGVASNTEKLLSSILKYEDTITEGKYDRLLYIEAIFANISLKQYTTALDICTKGLNHDPTETRFVKLGKKIRANLQTNAIEGRK